MMPLASLWTLVRREGEIYLKIGSEIKSEYGYIAGIRPHDRSGKGRETVIEQVEMGFSLLEKPKALSLDAFSWDDNSFSQCFKGCGGSNGFIKVWKAEQQDVESENEGAINSSHQQKRQATALPTLMPASKTARRSEGAAWDGDSNHEESACQIDNHEITKYFIGFYMLPIKTLVEPPETLLIRHPNRNFINSLKQEMIQNPIFDVQPILCIVSLQERDVFSEKHKEEYVYLTIGGNHSRIALCEILQEHPELNQKRNYTHRLCSVYSKMPNKIALCLASKHNRASTFCHDMTTWDKIIQCRRLLYDMSGEQNGEAEPPVKPAAWKKSCATILFQSVEQLDDGMIFYLASVQSELFCLVKNIYQLYANGKLKNQHIPKSKKGIQSKALDLKGSKFKGLRGLEFTDVKRLLQEVEECKITLGDLAVECNSIKMLAKVQAAFVKGTNCQNWEEATTKYADFCTPEQLEPFIKLNYSSKTLPEQFLKFCQRATRPHPVANSSTPSDNVFLASVNSSTCIFWKQQCFEVTLNALKIVFEIAGQEFQGFSLTIIDTPIEKVPNMQCGAVDAFVKELRLLIFTMNYHVGLQNFSIVFIVPLECLGKVADALKCNDDRIQLGVCNFHHSDTGNKSGNFVDLDETVSGLVIVRSGSISPLPKYASNCFSISSDPLIKDEYSKKALITTQKPVKFYKMLLELFTNKQEWVFDGYSGVGSCEVAALNTGRNCLAIENDSLLFLQSKVRLVTLTSVDDHSNDNLVEERMDTVNDTAIPTATDENSLHIS